MTIVICDGVQARVMVIGECYRGEEWLVKEGVKMNAGVEEGGKKWWMWGVALECGDGVWCEV